jgi:hypothetical protein
LNLCLLKLGLALPVVSSAFSPKTREETLKSLVIFVAKVRNLPLVDLLLIVLFRILFETDCWFHLQDIFAQNRVILINPSEPYLRSWRAYTLVEPFYREFIVKSTRMKRHACSIH